MNQNETPRAPGEAQGDGHALHGPSTEVTWDQGRGHQPYANRGDHEVGPATADEVEAGDLGARAGVNIEQLEEVKEKPERPLPEPPRQG